MESRKQDLKLTIDSGVIEQCYINGLLREDYKEERTYTFIISFNVYMDHYMKTPYIFILDVYE